ncbi:IS110 family transposase [Alicyclobacillus fastidiosus]|uniref:IS110 family transposase n=1 Tax=Alicyclobacillus fastidiosus TaxID=392011 RepID=A0ABV5ALZ2_9BACL|nr:IS110 family transposase [Alicyclobacillus fastidiosus]WEH07984.1 IS110 family transposase [Alicyclobacillus fastidiosus]WEH08387.1 IS110 family transposase [Alicyclobacillus fastidiosus]
MNPVVGLDIAKGESKGQVFLDKDTPHGKSFNILHTSAGLDQFHDVLRSVEELTGVSPTIIFESTGHYHKPITQFLDEQNYVYILVNPLIAYQAKKTSLRKVKTDALDAYNLCKLYYKEEFEPYKKRGIQLLDLRNLTRQHESITGLCIQTKLQFQAILDQVFPEFRGVFGDLYSKVSLHVLSEFPTADSVLAVTEMDLACRIEQLCPSRSERWAVERAKRLRAAAARNPFRGANLQSHLFSLNMYIKMLLQYQEHLSALENQIDALAMDIEEYEIIQSIPGIGGKIAATILSEIGEIDRFNHPKKLVAFAGVDPRVFESGKFTATVNRISKRGSSRLRHTLFVAVLCSLRKSGSQRLKAFYDRKREEGKPHKVAVIACANKLLHWIYAVLKQKEAFLDMP